jgi:hypothetical protein
MRSARLTLGLVLAGAGLVFTAQGLNLPFAPRSTMTSDPFWVLVGALLVAGGLAIALLGRRGSRAG